MSPKVIPSDSAYRDSHPFLYKGNHRDYHLSFLTSLMLLPFLTIPNRQSWWNPILSSKILHILIPMKTYVKWETLLGLALGIYECKGSVYGCKGSMYEC